MRWRGPSLRLATPSARLGTPHAFVDEVTRWDRILGKSPRADWIERRARVRERLLATLPRPRADRRWCTATASPATRSSTAGA